MSASSSSPSPPSSPVALASVPDAYPLDRDAELDAEAFVLRMGRALHSRGIPSHRLEEALEALCRKLGLSASFFATPTALFASFTQKPRPDVHMLRVNTPSSDLGKLSDLDAVSTAVVRGELSTTEGLQHIERIEAEPPRYGPWLLVPAYAVNSGAASLFFGGGLREVGTAFAIGLVTGLLALVSAARGAAGWRAFEPVAAFCAAVIATLAALWFGPVSVGVSVLAGLIALLPGYTLTVAMAELAHGHLASGSARMTSAFMAFITLGFGVALGTKIVERIFGVTPFVEPAALPPWASVVALAAAASTFAIIFRVKRRDLAWVLLVAVLGFSGARAGSHLLGPELGVFVGALVVAVLSNAYARVLDRPAVVPLFPGIMLLVPGSIGFRSLSSLMANDVVGGIQTGFTMILVAVALVAGLLLANELVPARRAL